MLGVVLEFFDLGLVDLLWCGLCGCCGWCWIVAHFVLFDLCEFFVFLAVFPGGEI